MNFISQTLSNLTSGGKIYIIFQIIYIFFGAFFLYVQWQILKELKRREAEYNMSNEKAYYRCIDTEVESRRRH